MKPSEILKATGHRPRAIPPGPWQYYQEWNDAVFLHWRVEAEEIQPFVPEELEVDLFDGHPWVSLVAFTMERIRPRHLPAFPPVSSFFEINIRTYVRYRGKAGVYFLSIEGGKYLSCWVAKTLSGLPYRYSKMNRERGHLSSVNAQYGDRFAARFRVRDQLMDKSDLDLWLTERYALFQDTPGVINAFDIHHVEWPVFALDLDRVRVEYSRFANLLAGPPDFCRYSPGVQVLAWGKKQYARNVGRGGV